MKISIVGLFLFTSVIFASHVQAQFVFWEYGGDTIEKVADFPDIPYFETDNGYMDIGIKYKEFTVFFIPLYQWDKSFVGVVPNNLDVYFEYTESELREFANVANITLPLITQVRLDFWKEWGGKFCILLILMLYSTYVYISRKSGSASE